ncbi:unnamed protein product [Pleuronectes platessa]|uniref:Transmembrane protein n=1 Tax=Pleuronectes platessa TaxID=8262 RepID=A0A9N7Z8Y0_PLEPL|nr:unnamed protein product [Pleuronectes platessa]
MERKQHRAEQDKTGLSQTDRDDPRPLRLNKHGGGIENRAQHEVRSLLGLGALPLFFFFFFLYLALYICDTSAQQPRRNKNPLLLLFGATEPRLSQERDKWLSSPADTSAVPSERAKLQSPIKKVSCSYFNLILRLHLLPIRTPRYFPITPKPLLPRSHLKFEEVLYLLNFKSHFFQYGGKGGADTRHSCGSALPAATFHFFDKPIDLLRRQMEAK